MPDEPQPAAGSTEPEEPQPQQHWFAELARDAVGGLLPVVISGAGLAALLIGIGGAVSFARFYAAGLPAHQAVNAATESDMRAIGLTWLVTAGLLGLLATFLAYIASPQGKATASMYYALIGIAAVEVLVVWQLARGDAGEELGFWDVAAVVVLLAGITTAVWIVARRHIHLLRVRGHEEHTDPPRLGTYCRQALAAGWSAVRKRLDLPQSRNRPTSDERAARSQSDPSLTTPARQAEGKEAEPVIALTLLDYALLGLISALVGAAVGGMLGLWWVAGSILTAGALGLLTIRVAALNKEGHERFRWYGICVFFSVGLFGGVLGVLRMFDEPRLQPVAFLHTKDGVVRAMQGVYVGESDDRLWFASVALARCKTDEVRAGSGRLRWLPEDEVSYTTIGPPMGLRRLAHEARAMLDDVMAEHAGPELVAGSEAVRDEVAVRGLGRIRTPSGWWVKLGSEKDLGSHPYVTLEGRRLPLHEDGDDWQVRLTRRTASGPIYAKCGERTNAAWLTVPRRPYAIATATQVEEGWWQLDARGSFDPDGEIDSYEWHVGDRIIPAARARAVRMPPDGIARLVVRDGDYVREEADGQAPQSLTGRSEVRLVPGLARTFPSDVLFCRDCRRLTKPGGMRRVRALRPEVAGADTVVIRAHTDERGSSAYNRYLSRARGRAVAKMLVPTKRRGLKVRVVAVGDSEAEAANHRANRRVEVIFRRG